MEARDYVRKNERLLTPLNTIMYVVQSSSPYDYSCLFNPANSITHMQTLMHKYLRPIRSFGAAYGSLRSLRSAFTMNTSHKKRTQTTVFFSETMDSHSSTNGERPTFACTIPLRNFHTDFPRDARHPQWPAPGSEYLHIDDRAHKSLVSFLKKISRLASAFIYIH